MTQRDVKTIFLVAAFGVAYVLLLYGGFGRNADVSPLSLLLAASSLTFVASTMLKVLGKVPTGLMSIAFFGGAYVAVIVDASVGTLAGGAERSLFPLEMMILTAVGIPGFIGGICVGWIVGLVRRSGPGA